MCGVKGRSN